MIIGGDFNDVNPPKDLPGVKLVNMNKWTRLKKFYLSDGRMEIDTQLANGLAQKNTARLRALWEAF